MNVEQLYKIVSDGKHLVVKMNANIGDYVGESFDPNMIAKIVGIAESKYDYDDGAYRLILSIGEYESHNKSVAVYDWYDGEKTWFDKEYYPKDGITEVYLSIRDNIPFEFVEDNPILNDYINENTSAPYIEWLENKVSSLSSSHSAD